MAIDRDERISIETTHHTKIDDSRVVALAIVEGTNGLVRNTRSNVESDLKQTARRGVSVVGGWDGGISMIVTAMRLGLAWLFSSLPDTQHTDR